MPSCGAARRTIQLGEKNVCTCVKNPFDSCGAGTYAAGVAAIGPKLPKLTFCCTSPTMPIIVRMDPPLDICRPTGSCSGEYLRTNAWLTTTTGALLAASASASARPRITGMRSASKYSGVTYVMLTS